MHSASSNGLQLRFRVPSNRRIIPIAGEMSFRPSLLCIFLAFMTFQSNSLSVSRHVQSLKTPGVLIVNLNRDVERGEGTRMALQKALQPGNLNEGRTPVSASCDLARMVWSSSSDPMRMLPFTAEDNTTACMAISKLKDSLAKSDTSDMDGKVLRWPATDASHPVGRHMLLRQADVHTRFMI